VEVARLSQQDSASDSWMRMCKKIIEERNWNKKVKENEQRK
jgi:hypothetical protein